MGYPRNLVPDNVLKIFRHLHLIFYFKSSFIFETFKTDLKEFSAPPWLYCWHSSAGVSSGFIRRRESIERRRETRRSSRMSETSSPAWRMSIFWRRKRRRLDSLFSLPELNREIPFTLYLNCSLNSFLFPNPVLPTQNLVIAVDFYWK